MLSEQVIFDDGHTRADLTVNAADGPQTFRRARLQREAERHSNTDDWSTFLLRSMAYPDIASTCVGTLTINDQTLTLDRLHPLTFETYLDLPEDLIRLLEDAEYRQNPQWMLKPNEREQDDAKKAVTNSGDA